MTEYRLLDAYLQLHHAGPEWGQNQLTNHGPMVAETLVRRGHGDGVSEWVGRYVERLDDLPRRVDLLSDANWRTALGDARRVTDWTFYFGRQLAERPWQEVLVRWWPRLLPGIAAGTTHGVIRVGHAVRALLADRGNDSGPIVLELAGALAFWAARYRVVPGSPALTGELDPASALDRLPNLGDQPGSVAERFARLPRTPAWAAALTGLRPPADAIDAAFLLGELVTAGTLQYRRHGAASPVLLVHAATAPNAILHTLPALPPQLWIRSLRAAWSATAAVSASYRLRPAAGRPDHDVLGGTVDDLFARAVGHGDEHVIKFTDTALDVYERTGNPAAPAAAALAAQLIDRPGR